MKLSTLSIAPVCSETILEADKGTIFNLFKDGLLRLYTTLNQKGNIGSLLQFISPKGDGIKAVKDLWKYLHSNDSIWDNREWWDSMFKTFGINDQNDRDDVLRAIRSQLPDQQTQQTQTATKQKGPRAALRDKIQQEKNRVAQQAEQDKTLEQLRIHNSQRIEENVLTAATENIRIAKIAIIVMAEMAKKKLANKLKEMGMSPEDLSRDLKSWNDIKQRFGGNIKPSDVLSPTALQQYRELAQRLVTAFKFLQPTLTNS